MDENTKIVLVACISGVVTIVTTVVGYLIGKVGSRNDQTK